MNKVTIYDGELKNFGDIIKYERTKRKISQEELAKEIGISRTKMLEIESGKYPSSDIIITLADKFKVSTDYLLGRVKAKKSSNYKISELTGLTDKAIKKLIRFYKKDLNKYQLDILYGEPGNYMDFSTIINEIIEQNNFEKLIYNIRAYINSLTKEKLKQKIEIKKFEDAEIPIDNEEYAQQYKYEDRDYNYYCIDKEFKDIINNISKNLEERFSKRWILNDENTKILKKCYDGSEKIKLLHGFGGVDGNGSSRTNKE